MNDDSLGKTITGMSCWCFGVKPIESLWNLQFAAGGHKFSQLCAFKFKSAMPNQKYTDFIIAFVAKMRSRIYRQASLNPSQWYIFKKISPVQSDVLGPEELFINYGFDINRFFASDVFKHHLANFKRILNNAVTNFIPDFESKNPNDVKEIQRYAQSIKEAIPELDKCSVNRKVYKLYIGSLGDKPFARKKFSTEAELDQKIEEEFKKQGIYADISSIADDMPKALNEVSLDQFHNIDDMTSLYYDIGNKLELPTLTDKVWKEKNIAGIDKSILLLYAIAGLAAKVSRDAKDPNDKLIGNEIFEKCVELMQ